MVVTLQRRLHMDPEGMAIVDDTGVTTWVELDNQANKWIWAFRHLGLAAGDRLAVLAGNRRELWEVFVAALHAGLVVVPLNWALEGEALGYVLAHSGARALILEERTRSAAVDVVPTGLSIRLTLDGPTGKDGFRSVTDLLYQMPPLEPEDQVAGAPMFYTSGTTGRPKGVISAGVAGGGGPVAVVAETAKAVIGGTGFPRRGCGMIVGPCYHSGQFVFATFGLLAGQRLVVRRGPDARDILRWIEGHRVTNVLLLPADFVALLALPDAERARFDSSSLRVVLHGGAPVPPDVKQRMLDWWGPVLVEYYGATEGGLFALASPEDWKNRPGTVGKVLPFLECRVVDVHGDDVGAGEEGLLYFRHLGGGRFRYHDDPERTAAAHLEPGLFTVGDVGWLDEDGYLYVSGREAHLITVGDKRVHPNRVEAVLSAHPAVADVGVFGAQADDGGQAVHAAVVLDGAEPGEALGDDLIAHAAASLPAAAVPVRLHFLEEIPRSAAGKILRDDLVQRIS